MEQLFPYILPQASSFAEGIDSVYWLITAVGFAFALGVSFFLILFVSRFRQGTKVNRVLPAHEGVALELIWTVIPLVIALGLFLYSTVTYFQTVRAPRDATEIFVVGKQWMWKIQHPNGRWEMNEIHIPVGKPVKLTMISEDVIHDFGLPAFRLNMDVVPGRYTQMWFNPTRVGRYHIFCAQYCGTNHAIMGGYVTVMEPNDFEKWMQTGNVSASLASQGETLFREQGCTGCHGPMANVRAPSLAGILRQRYRRANSRLATVERKHSGANGESRLSLFARFDYRSGQRSRGGLQTDYAVLSGPTHRRAGFAVGGLHQDLGHVERHLEWRGDGLSALSGAADRRQCAGA